MKRTRDAVGAVVNVDDDVAAPEADVAAAAPEADDDGTYIVESLGDGDCAYIPHVVSEREATRLYELFAPSQPALHYHKDLKVTMWDKEIPLPRWSAFVAKPMMVDLGAAGGGMCEAWPVYRYNAGATDEEDASALRGCQRMDAEVQALVDKATAAAARFCKHVPAGYNHIVVNYYANGRHHIGAHCDKTRDLSKDDPVLSFTLLDLSDPARQHARTLTLTHQTSKRKQSVILEHGSLFVLGTRTNGAGKLTDKVWKHQIDRVHDDHVNTVAPRISFTMRRTTTYGVIVDGTRYAFGGGSKLYPTLAHLVRHLESAQR